MPNRPWLTESMVKAIRAAIGAGIASTGTEAYSLIRSVTAASPAISVKLSMA